MDHKLKTASLNQKEKHWDKEYRDGVWDCLRWQIEDDRFLAVAEVISDYLCDSSFLEIGCGEGLLLKKIKHNFKNYIGVDVSSVALESAKKVKSEKICFFQADMETFLPTSNFDIILFNESLYYSAQPIELLCRYSKYLKPQGVLVTSIFESPGNYELVEKISASFKGIHRKTTNSLGSWHCQLFYPR